MELPVLMLPAVLFSIATSAWLLIRADRYAFTAQGHCSECGYNLSGLPSGRCPECGAMQLVPTAASESDATDRSLCPGLTRMWRLGILYAILPLLMWISNEWMKSTLVGFLRIGLIPYGPIIVGNVTGLLLFMLVALGAYRTARTARRPFRVVSFLCLSVVFVISGVWMHRLVLSAMLD